MREFHVLSLGAGWQSTALYLMAMDGEIPVRFDCAVFADTQAEPRAVYEHLAWLEAQGGPKIWRRTAGDLGSDLLEGRNSTGQRFVSIPAYTRHPDENEDEGKLRGQCSKEYKTEVVQRAIRRELLGLAPGRRCPRDVLVHEYFGITLDEAGRSVRIRRRKSEEGLPGEARFPLLERGMVRWDCHVYNQRCVPHPVPRSACVFCPMHSDAEWDRMKREAPDEFAVAVRLDERLREPDAMVQRAGVARPVYLHRSCRPLGEVEFTDPRQGEFGFARECEGMCGV